MPRKSEAGWLVEPGAREIPREAIEEAKELLGRGKEYACRVVEAWLRRRVVKWSGYHFWPKLFGVEVYARGEYERSWRNRAIEIVFYKLALEGEAVLAAAVKATAPETKESER